MLAFLLCLALATARAVAVGTGSPTQRLLRDGYVVFDGVVSTADVAGIRASVSSMLERGRMMNLGQDGRDDDVAVLDPNRLDHPSYGTLGVAGKVLADLPAMLVDSGRRDADATPEGLAHLASAVAPTRLMLAHYPATGGRYVSHLDNDPTDPSHQVGPVGMRACDRVFTCILYLNDEWEEAHAGCLRIFTSSDTDAEPDDGDDEPWQPQNEEEEEEEMAAALEEASAAAAAGQRGQKPAAEGDFVDIEPRGGRLVVFDSSRMLHEVRPSFASRWALTAWI